MKRWRKDPYTDKAPWTPDPPDRPKSKATSCWGCGKQERKVDRYCHGCWEARGPIVLKFREKAEAMREAVRHDRAT